MTEVPVPPPAGKMGKAGLLELVLVEVRDTPCAYCTIQCEALELATKPKKKTEANPQFDETFLLSVNRPSAVLTILVWEKKMFGKDKPTGYFAIPLSKLLRTPAAKKPAEWFSLVAPSKAVIQVGGDFIASGKDVSKAAEKDKEEAEATPAADDDPTSPRGKEVGRIRLQLYLHVPEAEKPKLSGIIVDGEWKEGLNGGNILGNPFWYENPQFLLTVGSARDITLSLLQESEKAEPGTFYVVKYNDPFYKGRRMACLTMEDIMKVEGDFMAPVVSLKAETTTKLLEGTYCIIPCTSFKATDEGIARYNGKFKLAAKCDRVEVITLVSLPTDPLLAWKEAKIQGEWTADTCGGADVTGTMWSKNPQFLLTTSARSDVCVVLNQRVATYSIGLYVIRVEGAEATRKAVVYTNEVGATPNCVFACSTGVKMTGLPAGTYVIIPCTYELQMLGKFELVAFASEAAAPKLEPLTKDWKHKRVIKARWDKDHCGGSPNFDTFTDNPQFSLVMQPKGDDERQFFVQLIQSRAKKSPAGMGSIGIVCLKTDDAEQVDADDVCQESLLCQTEGWAPQRCVSVAGTLKQELDEGKGYVCIIPSTMNPGEEYKFTLAVYSDAKISLKSLDEEESEDEEDAKVEKSQSPRPAEPTTTAEEPKKQEEAEPPKEEEKKPE